MSETKRPVRAILLGDDLGLTKRWSAIALGLFTLVLAIYVAGYYQSVYSLLPGQAIIVGGGTVLVLLAAWQTYQNRSFVLSLLVCIAPVSALFIRIVGAGQTSTPTVGDTLLLGVGWGLVFGVPLGALGFLLGYAARTVTKPDAAA